MVREHKETKAPFVWDDKETDVSLLIPPDDTVGTNIQDLLQEVSQNMQRSITELEEKCDYCGHDEAEQKCFVDILPRFTYNTLF